MTEEKTIDLLECFSCGSKHTGIPLHEYNCPNPPWTHHYVCPASGDPVSIATAEVAGKPTIIHQDIANFLSVARRAGHYLLAVFYKKEIGAVTESKPLLLNLRTEEYDMAWGDLTWMMLRDEVRRMQDRELGVDQVDDNDYPKPTPIDPDSLPGLNLFSDPSDVEMANEQLQRLADEADVSVPAGFGKSPIQSQMDNLMSGDEMLAEGNDNAGKLLMDQPSADVPPTGFGSVQELYGDDKDKRGV